MSVQSCACSELRARDLGGRRASPEREVRVRRRRAVPSRGTSLGLSHRPSPAMFHHNGEPLQGAAALWQPQNGRAALGGPRRLPSASSRSRGVAAPSVAASERRALSSQHQGCVMRGSCEKCRVGWELECAAAAPGSTQPRGPPKGLGPPGVLPGALPPPNPYSYGRPICFGAASRI
jgi:hypothetical protein